VQRAARDQRLEAQAYPLGGFADLRGAVRGCYESDAVIIAERARLRGTPRDMAGGDDEVIAADFKEETAAAGSTGALRLLESPCLLRAKTIFCFDLPWSGVFYLI
jgi:hypothetical protein